MRTRLLITAALAAATLSACGSATSGTGSTDGGSTAPSSAPPSATSTPSLPGPSSTPTVPPPADSTLPVGLEDRPEVKAAMADAAGRAGIVPGQVVLAGYLPVTWADGSLGCPQKGMAYPQMTVEGELLLLRVDQRVMEYHARLNGPFTYCANPSGAYRPRTAG
ncbi:hypothetical protein [Phycicoccus sp.]|uniref:hypothetical protein n=1 Tax=Phycicoccus sp. TaxID=1902410 RepID=UPI002C0FA9C4|nr:hypothetical protein [Phycicoccus sp.]HMM96609.1 hypothetical protein [Phycicoccus sp.]